MYSSYSFTTSALVGVSGQRHATERTPRYPLDRRLRGPQSRSGHRGRVKTLLLLPGIEPRSPGRPGRSQTLIQIYINTHTHTPYTFMVYSNVGSTFSSNVFITILCILLALNVIYSKNSPCLPCYWRKKL
jgi:hypothetical protein